MYVRIYIWFNENILLWNYEGIEISMKMYRKKYRSDGHIYKHFGMEMIFLSLADCFGVWMWLYYVFLGFWFWINVFFFTCKKGGSYEMKYLFPKFYCWTSTYFFLSTKSFDLEKVIQEIRNLVSKWKYVSSKRNCLISMEKYTWKHLAYIIYTGTT